MNDRRTLLMSALALAAGALAGHGALAATITSTSIATEERPAQGFEAVDWCAIGELHIEQGNEERVRVEAEPQVLPKIRTDVRNGCLYVDLAPGSISTSQPVRVSVTAKRLSSLRTKGAGSTRIGSLRTDGLQLDLAASGDVLIDRLEARRLAVQLSGSGDVTIARGSVDEQRVTIGGSGQYVAPSLASRRSTVRIDGAGRVQVAAQQELVASIEGSGDIEYRGDPAVHQRIEGAGRVTRIN
jgi:hypothetical protein